MGLAVTLIANAGTASSLGDATDANSIIRLGLSGNEGVLSYIGTAAASTDRQIQVNAGPAAVGNSAVDPGHTLIFTNPTFNAQTVNGTARTLTLQGTNTGNNEVQGVIRDNDTGVISLTKASDGKWIVSGLNTFSGKAFIDEGTLSVNTLEDAGTASSLGTGNTTPTIQFGFGARTGTLEYTGPETSTNRQIQIGRASSGTTETGGGIILNNGSGALTFSANAPYFNAPQATATKRRNLTLGGSNTDQNTISGVIVDNDTGAGGIVSLTKEGAGTWVLAGANVYNGDTTISGGTLTLGVSSALASSTDIKLGTATLDAGTFTNSVSSLDVTGTATINLGTGAALAFTDSKLVDWTGGTLNITGTLGATSLRFGDSADDLDPAQLALISVNGSGTGTYILDVNGYLIPGAVSGYAAWQSANSTGQTADLDHDNDGVTNGVEHFLFGTADSTGNSNPLPGVDVGPLSVTWTKAATYTGTYGTDFVVETSATLSDPWVTEIADPDPGFTVTFPTANEVKYTFPAGTKNFARLKVVAP